VDHCPAQLSLVRREYVLAGPLFPTLNVIDFPEASIRAVKHYDRIRREAGPISV
jgi:hypothetical protein